MNVSCPECSTLFVIDDAQIPPGGLQVQCTSCGAVFNASKPSESLPPARADSEWMIRQPSGNVFRLRELTTLQRWIVERKVGRDDEISKTGQKWERLGNIPELAAFFQVVETNAVPQVAMPAGYAAGQPNAGVMSGVHQAPVSGEYPTPAQSGVHQGPVSGDYPTGGGQTHPHPSGPYPQPNQGSGRPSAPTLPSDSALAGGAAWESNLDRTEPAHNDGWEMHGDIDDLDEHDFAPRRGGGGRWLLVLLLLVGAGIAGFYFLKPREFQALVDSFIATESAEALAAASQARSLLAPDTVEAYGASEAVLDAVDDDYPDVAELAVARAEVLLSRVHHARRHQRLAASLEKAAAEPSDGDSPATSRSLYPGALTADEQDEKLRQAGVLLKKVLTTQPELFTARRAMADYQRLQGKLESAKAIVAETEAMKEANGDAMLRLYAAEVAEDTDALRALRSAEPALLRASLDLAAALAEAGDHDAAQDVADAILKNVEHPTARLLVAKVESPAPTPAPEPEPEGSKEKLDFGKLVAAADRARRSDRASRALRLYERALEIEPSNVEVLTGLGWSYLDLENATSAVATFERVLRRNERFSDAHMGLAEALKKLGRRTKALEHYRRYLELVPQGPDAPAARRMVEELSR
ncbi:MAG: tetratricopeptide repeat protein, partial [Myxococcota bacterium]